MSKVMLILFAQVVSFWLLLKQHFQHRACFLFFLSFSFSFSLSSKVLLYMLQLSVTLVLVLLSIINAMLSLWMSFFYAHNNLYIFISYSNIKDPNLHMLMTHVTNSCLHENHIKQHVFLASDEWKSSQNNLLPKKDLGPTKMGMT